MPTENPPEQAVLSDLKSSLLELKNSALNIQSVHDWVRQNLGFFGVTPELSPYTTCTLDFDFNDMTLAGAESLSIGIILGATQQTAELSGIYAEFPVNARADKKTLITQYLLFEVKDWPFIVIELLVRRLPLKSSQPAAEDDNVGKLLQQYVPVHFPGMKLEKLNALYCAGLLPVNEHDLLLSTTLGAFLFDTRNDETSSNALDSVESVGSP